MYAVAAFMIVPLAIGYPSFPNSCIIFDLICDNVYVKEVLENTLWSNSGLSCNRCKFSRR